MYFVLALCLYCFYSLFSFLVMFYSYYIDVQLSHLNKDYLLNIQMIQPTSVQHVRRAVFQGSHVSGQALLPAPALLSPTNWGWVKTSN